MVNTFVSKKETQRAGTIAMDLVMRTLCHTGKVKSKKPSMTNWPAYVPVIVELYPAANNPMAQMYLEELPKVDARASEASSKVRSSTPGCVITYDAKVPITAALIMNEMNREIPLSIML